MSEAFKLAPHKWALLRGLLDEALALPVARRSAWLAELDESRAPGLKPRLEALLANAGSDDDPGTAARLLRTSPKVESGQFCAATRQRHREARRCDRPLPPDP